MTYSAFCCEYRKDSDGALCCYNSKKRAGMLQYILIDNSRKYFNANIATIYIHSSNFLHPSVTDIFTKLDFHFFFRHECNGN